MNHWKWIFSVKEKEMAAFTHSFPFTGEVGTEILELQLNDKNVKMGMDYMNVTIQGQSIFKSNAWVNCSFRRFQP